MDLTIPPPIKNIKLTKPQIIARNFKNQFNEVLDVEDFNTSAGNEIKLLSSSSSFSQTPSNTMVSRELQLTEEDFLKMKQKSIENDLKLSTLEKESIVSNADSVSNFEENSDIMYDDTEDEETIQIKATADSNGEKVKYIFILKVSVM